MKETLITGASGFIGRHLVQELSSRGHEIRVLSRNFTSTDKNVRVYKGDITDFQSIKRACHGVENVFHLAALTNVDRLTPNPDQLFRKINVEGTLNVLNACESAKRFIHFSSVDALGIIQNKLLDEDSEGKPAHPYEVTKLQSELVVKKFSKELGINYTILRPTSVYGEGELSASLKTNVAVLKMCKMIQKHSFPILGSGKNLFPFTHVKNIVEGAILALNSNISANKTYNLGDERSYQLNEVVKTIANILNVKFTGFHVPLIAAYPSAIFFEILEKTLKVNVPLTRQGIEYMTASRMFSIEKAKKELNYNPIDLKEGLSRTISWYKEKGYL